MAEISDLTTAQQTILVGYNFNDLLSRLDRLLARYVPINDADKVESDWVKKQMVDLRVIIQASGNTAAVTADAILNP